MKLPDQIPRKSPEEIKFTAGDFSLPSEKHPEVNIDSHFSLPEQGAFGVFDGAGTKPNATIAAAVSRMSQEYVKQKISEWTENLSPEETADRLSRILLEAHGVIKNKAEQSPEFVGGSTTASVVKFCQVESAKAKVVIANLSNSRVYILQKNGNLEQITLDDARLYEYLRRFKGKTDEEIRDIQARYSQCTDLGELSEEERDWYVNEGKFADEVSSWGRNRIGAANCVPKTYIANFEEGDVLAVVCDGIFDNLVDPKIAEILNEKTENQIKAERLVRTAWDIGHSGKDKNFRATKDDLTAVVVSL